MSKRKKENTEEKVEVKPIKKATPFTMNGVNIDSELYRGVSEDDFKAMIARHHVNAEQAWKELRKRLG